MKKRQMKKWLFAGLTASGLPFLLREVVQRRRVTIVLYHDVTPARLDRHLETLKSCYNLISLEDYIEARESGDTCRVPPKSLIITLDDGHKGNFELLSVLEKHRAPATIFLCTQIVGTNRHFWFLGDGVRESEELWLVPDERRLELLSELGFDEKREEAERQALTWDEVDTMKHQVDFQSHTQFHPILPRCSDQKARRELVDSKANLEFRGLKVHTISYPNGDYSHRDISLARQAGYRCGITVDLGYNSDSTDLFKLKRICLDDEADNDEIKVRVSGLWDFGKKIMGPFRGVRRMMSRPAQ